MSLAALLNQTCAIKRKTTVIDSTVNAGAKATWASLATGVPCSLQAESERESFQSGREAGVRFYQCFLAFGQDVVETDMVTVGSRWFTVVGVSPDDSGRQAYARLTLREVKGEAPV